MIILLGQNGYIGSAFAAELTDQRLSWMPATHLNFESVILSQKGCDLVINCAGFIPEETVALCDASHAETIRGNLLLPVALANLCRKLDCPLAHISTGYLWNDGLEHGEVDGPQKCFRGRLGFYVGTKVLAEEEVAKHRKHYIWRISLAFDQGDQPRNYLRKLALFETVFDRRNVVTHRGDLAKTCLSMVLRNSRFGTYHMMNPCIVKATWIIERMLDLGIRSTRPQIVSEEEGDSLPSVRKLLELGFQMRTSEEAIQHSLKNWTPPV